jgi:hypothetical protein
MATIILKPLNSFNGKGILLDQTVLKSSIWLVFAAAALMGLVNSWKRQELVLDLASLWHFMTNSTSITMNEQDEYLY